MIPDITDQTEGEQETIDFVTIGIIVAIVGLIVGYFYFKTKKTKKPQYKKLDHFDK